MRAGQVAAGCAALLLALAAWPAGAQDLGTVKVGVLEFGTVNWELDVIKHHGLDRARGFTLEVQAFASGQATNVALQGEAVDAIVDDYLWVSRQRSDGQMLTFIPFSSTVGALMVPQDSDGREPRRPQGPDGRHRGRAGRQELAAAPGARGAAPRDRARRRGRAGVRRAAAAQREGRGRRARCGAQLLALHRAPRGPRATGSWSASRRRSASSASRACRRSSATSSTRRSPRPTRS